MVVVMDPDPGMDVVTRMPRVMTATVARALAWVTGVIVAMDRGLVMAGVPGMAAARALAWAIGATGAMARDRDTSKAPGMAAARALAWAIGATGAMARDRDTSKAPGMAAARALAWAIGATGAMVQDRVMDRGRVMVQGAGTVRVLPPGVSPVMTVAARKTVIMDRGPDTDQVPTKAATLAFAGGLDPARATATIRASE